MGATPVGEARDELTRLLVAARDGERGALEAFIRATEPEIRRFCLHMVGSAEADDATQETYLGVWRSLGSFRAESSARTWLFVVARRTTERMLRRRRRLAALDEHVRPPRPSPAPELAGEPLRLLAALDPDRRAAMALTQLIGLSYAEAAQVCGCPVGTIRSRVARARDELLAAREQEAAAPRTG